MGAAYDAADMGYGGFGQNNFVNDVRRKPNYGQPQPPPQRKPYEKKSQGPPAAKDKRTYEKPWQVPEKKKSEVTKDTSTFLHSVYPDGIGPDSDLIQMLERDVIDKNPNVSFDDIAEL